MAAVARLPIYMYCKYKLQDGSFVLTHLDVSYCCLGKGSPDKSINLASLTSWATSSAGKQIKKRCKIKPIVLVRLLIAGVRATGKRVNGAVNRDGARCARRPLEWFLNQRACVKSEIFTFYTQWTATQDNAFVRHILCLVCFRFSICLSLVRTRNHQHQHTILCRRNCDSHYLT